jgi:hypothetical protein
MVISRMWTRLPRDWSNGVWRNLARWSAATGRFLFCTPQHIAELTFSAEHVPQQTVSTMSLDSVARALPHPSISINTSIYTSRDPVRQSSLNDVSESLTLGHPSPNGTHTDRPSSAASNFSATSRTTTAGSRSATPVNGVRRKPPAPPSKKFSVSSNSLASTASSDDLESVGQRGSEVDLVHEGAKGVPPPIIEVQAPQDRDEDHMPQGWITFTA